MPTIWHIIGAGCINNANTPMDQSGQNHQVTALTELTNDQSGQDQSYTDPTDSQVMNLYIGRELALVALCSTQSITSIIDIPS